MFLSRAAAGTGVVRAQRAANTGRAACTTAARFLSLCPKEPAPSRELIQDATARCHRAPGHGTADRPAPVGTRWRNPRRPSLSSPYKGYGSERGTLHTGGLAPARPGRSPTTARGQKCSGGLRPPPHGDYLFVSFHLFLSDLFDLYNLVTIQ